MIKTILVPATGSDMDIAVFRSALTVARIRRAPRIPACPRRCHSNGRDDGFARGNWRWRHSQPIG